MINLVLIITPVYNFKNYVESTIKMFQIKHMFEKYYTALIETKRLMSV